MAGGKRWQFQQLQCIIISLIFNHPLNTEFQSLLLDSLEADVFLMPLRKG